MGRFEILAFQPALESQRFAQFTNHHGFCPVVYWSDCAVRSDGTKEGLHSDSPCAWRVHEKSLVLSSGVSGEASSDQERAFGGGVVLSGAEWRASRLAAGKRQQAAAVHGKRVRVRVGMRSA